jgi:2-C-methyl-D-erythritol 4-phosphate cytidylyltransferase
MSTLILPCAGRSTRFPGTRPKWALTHPCGELMLLESIKGLDLTKFERIVAIFVKQDLEKTFVKIRIRKSF